MSQPKERVEHPSGGSAPSSQPYRKSRAPPPPSSHRNPQPSVHSQNYLDYHKHQGNNQQDPGKRHETYDSRNPNNASSHHRRSDHYANDPLRGHTNGPDQDYQRSTHSSAGGRGSNERQSRYSENPSVESGKHDSNKSSREPKSQRQSHNTSTALYENTSAQWVPKSQRQDPGGKEYKSQEDLTGGFESASREPKSRRQLQYNSNSALNENPSSQWVPKSQRQDPGGKQYKSQQDLTAGFENTRSHRQQYASQGDLNKNTAHTSWEPRAQRKDGHQYHSQHDLSNGQQQYPSQSDLRKPAPTHWEPRSQRHKSSGNEYQLQDLSAASKSQSKSQQSLPAAAQGLSTGHSMTHLPVSNPVDIKTESEGARRYQRNSAYKPQQNRHSSNLGHVPADSTQSLHNPRSLGHTNPALARSAVSLNPSANSAALTGQGDLAGGLSTSRLSLASQTIYRNPSMASLVASNPSLYRTVSAMSLYEAGMQTPSTYFPITIAGCILCCPIGVIGILFSIMARDALEVKDYPRAVRWGSIALWTGVTFIIGGVVLILTLSLVLGLYFS